MVYLLLTLILFATLSLLASLVCIARLQALTSALTDHFEAEDKRHLEEVAFQRKQIEALQQQLLAVAVPAAQARLHFQSLPPEARPNSEHPPVRSSRNPLQVDVPPAWAEPNPKILRPLDWEPLPGEQREDGETW